MKEFKRGDLVKSNNKYSDVHEKESVYLGIVEVSERGKYHVVGIERAENDITTVFIKDNEIVLLAEVFYVEVSKYKKGDIVYFNEEEIVLVSDRVGQVEEVGYYGVTTHEINSYTEVLYFKESELSKTNHKEQEEEVETTKEIPLNL